MPSNYEGKAIESRYLHQLWCTNVFERTFVFYNEVYPDGNGIGAGSVGTTKLCFEKKMYLPGGCQQRPPSSSLSYGGAVNDDVRSPGSGGTPGPLSQPPPQTLDATDPGEPLAITLCVHRRDTSL